MEDISQLKDHYGEKLRGAAQDAQERFSDAGEQARVKSQELWDQANALIREHPAAAVGIAMLGGAVIGGILASALRTDKSSLSAAVQAASEAPNLQGAKESVAKKLGQLRDLLDEAIVKLQ